MKKGVDGYCILGKMSQQDEVLPPSIDIYLELRLELAPTPVESFAIQPTEVPQHQPLPPSHNLLAHVISDKKTCWRGAGQHVLEKRVLGFFQKRVG